MWLLNFSVCQMWQMDFNFHKPVKIWPAFGVWWRYFTNPDYNQYIQWIIDTETLETLELCKKKKELKKCQMHIKWDQNKNFNDIVTWKNALVSQTGNVGYYSTSRKLLLYLETHYSTSIVAIRVVMKNPSWKEKTKKMTKKKRTWWLSLNILVWAKTYSVWFVQDGIHIGKYF